MGCAHRGCAVPPARSHRRLTPSHGRVASPPVTCGSYDDGMSDQAVAEPADRPASSSELDYEVIVIGAGVAGIYQIKKLTDLGVDALVLEGHDDLGGTWHMNRYPGARFDSESYTYGYTFSQELLDEWHWTEMFSPQPETLKYLHHVADKFDLRQYMRFNTRVEAMTFDDDTDAWTLRLGDGSELRCHFVVTAIGVLSMPTMPNIDGMADFEGESFHTFEWPHEPPSLAGKRVAVIGTGATAIQLIPRGRQAVWPAHGVPTAGQLGGTAQQPSDLRRGDGRDPVAVRPDLRIVRQQPGWLRAHARPTRLGQRHARGAARTLGPAVRRPRLRHLAPELRRDLHGRGRQRRVLRLHRRPDPPAGSTTPSWPRSSSRPTTASGSNASPSRVATSRPTTATTSP